MSRRKRKLQLDAPLNRSGLKPVFVRLPSGLVNKLRAKAKNEQRTLAATLKLILEAAL